MQIKKILPEFGVSPQISPVEVADVAAAGYKSIICNRPNGEGADQPDTEQIRAAAQAAGIEFRDIPFTAGKQTAQDVQSFRAALNELPGPVLAFCRTGSRSAKIWAQARVADHPVQETIELVTAAGIDMATDRPILEQIARASQGNR